MLSLHLHVVALAATGPTYAHLAHENFDRRRRARRAEDSQNLGRLRGRHTAFIEFPPQKYSKSMSVVLLMNSV